MSLSSSDPARLRQAFWYLSAGLRHAVAPGELPASETETFNALIVRLRKDYRDLLRPAGGPPELSVVIPLHVRDSAVRFLGTIQSLLANDQPPPTEIVVVLNGKASTTDLMNSPLHRLASDIGLHVLVISYLDEERYRNIERPQNIFVAKQRGFEEARGRIVVSADADCQFSPLWLAAYADYFNAHPGSPAAYGPVQLFGTCAALGRVLAWISTSVKAFKVLLDFPPFAGHNHAFRKQVCLQFPHLYERIIVDCQELPPLLRKQIAPREPVTRLIQCVPQAISSTFFSAGRIDSPGAAFGWFIENARRNLGNYRRTHRA